MKIKGCPNFRYEEFIPKELFSAFSDTPLWVTNYISCKLPPLAQFIRDRYKKSITINDWLWNSSNDGCNYSGYRPLDCSIGSTYSRHKLGLCIDIKVRGIVAPEIQKDILDNPDIFMEQGVTAIEADTPTWTHISVENTDWMKDNSKIWVIPNPSKKSS